MSGYVFGVTKFRPEDIPQVRVASFSGLEWRKVKCIDPRDPQKKRRIWVSLLHSKKLHPALTDADNAGSVDIVRTLVNPVSLVNDPTETNIEILDIRVVDPDFHEQTLQYTVLTKSGKKDIEKMMAGDREEVIQVEITHNSSNCSEMGDQGPNIVAAYQDVGVPCVREFSPNEKNKKTAINPRHATFPSRRPKGWNKLEISKNPAQSNNSRVGESAVNPQHASSWPKADVYANPQQSSISGFEQYVANPGQLTFQNVPTHPRFAEPLANEVFIDEPTIRSLERVPEYPLAFTSDRSEQAKATRLERLLAEYHAKYPVQGPVEADDTPHYCICDGPADNGDFMVACSNGENYCLGEWYHIGCIGMKRENVPTEDEDWFCDGCIKGKLRQLRKSENAHHLAKGKPVQQKKPETEAPLVQTRPMAVPRSQWGKAAKKAASKAKAKAKGKAVAHAEEIAQAMAQDTARIQGKGKPSPKRADPLPQDSLLQKRPLHPNLSEVRVMNSAVHPTYEYDSVTVRLWKKDEKAAKAPLIQELRKDFPTRKAAIEARESLVKEVSGKLAEHSVPTKEIDRKIEELDSNQAKVPSKFEEMKREEKEKRRAEKGKGKALTIQTGPLSMSDPSENHLVDPWSANFEKSFLQEMTEDYNLTNLGSAKGALRGTGSASATSTPPTSVRRKTKWTEEEENHLIDVVRACVDSGLKGEAMWETAYPMLQNRGVGRSIAGMKMMWCRGLRERTNIDERRRQDAENLRTAIQDGQRRQRGRAKPRLTHRAKAIRDEEEQMAAAILLSMVGEKPAVRKPRSTSAPARPGFVL